MKRSTWVALAATIMSMTVMVESASAQYYHQPRRPQQNRGGNDLLLPFIAGVVGGVVAGVIISEATRNSMRQASHRVYDRDVEDGYRSEFEGDGHRGYHEVVSQGRTDQYNRCRLVRTVVEDRYGRPVPEYERRRPRCVCLNERSDRWVDVDEEDYIPRPIARRPYGSIRVNPRHEAPMYRPYEDQRRYVRPTAPIAVPRPYRPVYGQPIMPYQGRGAPAIAGPARTTPPVHRPSYAPPVLPHNGAPGVIR
jgi:hypothetical protein